MPEANRRRQSPLSIRLSEREADLLRQISERRGLPVAWTVRQLIAEEAARIQAPAEPTP